MICTFYDYTQSQISSQEARSVVVIGNLDGLHLGHQSLIALAATLASQGGAALCALTFDPHPARYFASRAQEGRRAPPMLYSVEDKLSLLARLGVKRALCQRFDATFAALSPEDFVGAVLCDALRACAVVVGEDFAFGAQRSGRVEDLRRLCGERGVEVRVAPPLRAPTGEIYSSTWARALVAEGQVEGARQVLGRPYHLRGEVARGYQRGRSLGFPTANLALHSDLCPAAGVYAGWLDWGEGPAPCVVSVGENPTFNEPHRLAGQQRWSVEAHALLSRCGFERHQPLDLYGREVILWFEGRLRDMLRFEGVEALRAQIALDCEAALSRLGLAGEGVGVREGCAPPAWPSAPPSAPSIPT